MSTATYLQMKQCKFTCNDANTIRYTENIRRENYAFNVKIKALLQNESQYMTDCYGSIIYIYIYRKKYLLS